MAERDSSTHHLSGAIRSIIDIGQNPDLNLDLNTVEQGRVLYIEFGNGSEKWSISVRMTREGVADYHGQHPVGIIVAGNFLPDYIAAFGESGLPIPPIGVECTLLGACTYNPSAEYSGSMLRMHYLTTGRSFQWATPTFDDQAMLWTTPEVVTSWSIK